MRREFGFTLAELSMALAIIALLSAVLVPFAFDQVRQGRIDASINQARSVLRICDMVRRSVLSTSVDANGVTTHTYPVLPNWSNTSALQALLASNYNIPDKNPLGSSILVKFDQARCYVAVDLPMLEDGYGGFQTTTVAGNTRVLISSKPVRTTYPGWVTQQKRVLNGETTR